MARDAAVPSRDLFSARAALRNGANPNRRMSDGLTPLMIAAAHGDASLVEALLASGADPLAIEPRMGATALHKAAQSGSVKALDLLIDHGAFVDQQSPVLGNTPLVDAVLHKHEAAVRLLLTRGARTKIRNHWSQSALELAREDGSNAIADAIERHEAHIAAEAVEAPLLEAIRSGDLEAVTRLIAAGADVNQRVPAAGGVDDGYTPLGLATRGRQVEIVGLLLDAGADLDGEMGLMRGNAIHEAAFLGYSDVLAALLKHPGHAEGRVPGLDAQGAYNGFSPLHDAVWHGHEQAASELVAAGAPLHLRAHTGLTPHELAELYGYDELARTLVPRRS